MASTAALMAGLHSFDSSDAAGQSHIEGVTHGGITFGSVAPSFHSEDYDDEPPPIAAAASSKPVTHAYEDESSILDEQEVEPPVEDERLARRTIKTKTRAIATATVLSNRPGQMRPHSAMSGGERTTATSSSSRNPSASTAATTEPSPKRAPLVSTGALHALDNSTGDDSGSRIVGDRTGLLTELDLDDDSARWSGVKARKNGKTKAANGGLGQNMTLREQEKVIDEFKKENFDLKLKIHFYEQRLERLAPDQIDQALRENVQLKVEFQTLRTELKRYKKLLLEGNRAIETLKIERDAAARSGNGGTERERRLEKELARWRDASERERQNAEALEARVEKQARELRELRNRSADLNGEDARTEIGRLRNELDAEREAREDDLAEQDDLRYQVRELVRQLEETREENAQLREEGVRDDRSSMRGDDSSMIGADRRRGKRAIERELQDVKQENATLRAQTAAQLTMLAARHDELASVQEQLEDAKHDVHDLEIEMQQQERARARSDRSLSSAGGSKTVEQLEEENDVYRDRAAAHALEVEQLQIELAEKEREIEVLLEEHDNVSQDHDLVIKQIDEEWRDTVEDAEARKTEALDMLEEREADVQELGDKCKQLVQEIEELETERDANAQEVQALTSDLQQLAGQIRELENDLDERDAKIDELSGALESVDREAQDKQSLHDQVLAALKEKLATHKARAGELTIQHESKVSESNFLREKVEELALRLAELEEQVRVATAAKRKLEDEAVEIMRALRKEEEEHDADQKEAARLRRELEVSWQSRLDQQTKDLEQARDEMRHYKNVLEAREVDVQKLQEALNGLETSSRRLGEDHTNDRFALEVECDRLKRDLARCEQDLAAAKDDLEDKAAAIRAKDMTLATLQSENKDLSADLAEQTQARLGLTDKHDAATKSLRDTQLELSAARDRLRVVEDQLNTDHRQLSRTENQYRDQLTERNTLLLTIYQYMDKIIGGNQRKSGQADPKPFTNFAIFHDSLISRLKGVNQLQMTFDRRTRDIETKFTDQFAALKRQQDSRLKQLDRFEASIKTATETQRQWRHRVHTKQGEVDAARAQVQELQAQMASLRSSSSSPTSPRMTADLADLSKRAATAERRLAATQAQLRSAEEKLGDARSKVAVAEGKWEARLREMETRLRAAEEKVKRERQGAKERVGELTQTIKDLQAQVARAGQRAHLLDGVLDETQKNKQRVGQEL